VDARLGELAAPAKTIIDGLLWWTRTPKTARVTASERPACSEPRRFLHQFRRVTPTAAEPKRSTAVKAEVGASETRIQMVLSDMRAASAA
jgi:hypothetical protein